MDEKNYPTRSRCSPRDSHPVRMKDDGQGLGIGLSSFGSEGRSSIRYHAPHANEENWKTEHDEKNDFSAYDGLAYGRRGWRGEMQNRNGGF